MLINSESKFKSGDILALKNILGEEILATYVESDGNKMIVKDIIAMGMTPEGQPGFMKAMVFGDISGEIVLHKDHYLFIVKAEENIASAYTQQLSGLLIPKENKKIVT